MPGRTLTLATANLLHGIDPATGLAEPAALTAAADDLAADVLGLQEVDRYQPRSGGVDQAGVLAARLAAGDWRFVATLEGDQPGGLANPRKADAQGESRRSPLTPVWSSHVVDLGEDRTPGYGIALLSRLPVHWWAVRRFPAAPLSLPLLIPSAGGPRVVPVPDEPRAALAAGVETPWGAVTVITAHLSFVPGWNVGQLIKVCRWARRLPGPRVLLGDFNLPGPLPRWLTGWRRLARVATYPSWAPRVQFDHVLAHDFPARAHVEVAARRLPISDHRAVVVSVHG